MWQPGWESSLGEMDTRVSIAKALDCSPETIMTLLMGYSLRQNKKLKKNKIMLWKKKTDLSCHNLKDTVL